MFKRFGSLISPFMCKQHKQQADTNDQIETLKPTKQIFLILIHDTYNNIIQLIHHTHDKFTGYGEHVAQYVVEFGVGFNYDEGVFDMYLKIGKRLLEGINITDKAKSKYTNLPYYPSNFVPKYIINECDTLRKNAWLVLSWDPQNGTFILQITDKKPISGKVKHFILDSDYDESFERAAENIIAVLKEDVENIYVT